MYSRSLEGKRAIRQVWQSEPGYHVGKAASLGEWNTALGLSVLSTSACAPRTFHAEVFLRPSLAREMTRDELRTATG
jgi:hypothetical protein